MIFPDSHQKQYCEQPISEKNPGVSETGIFVGHIWPSRHPTINVKALKGTQTSNHKPHGLILSSPTDVMLTEGSLLPLRHQYCHWQLVY